MKSDKRVLTPQTDDKSIPGVRKEKQKTGIV